MARKKFVTYVRVSTKRQGDSGLGLDAQREAIRQYLLKEDGELLSEFDEVESGKRDDRPELAKALQHCKRTGSILLVAKLDRLSRDMAFTVNLMKSGVEFVIADFPAANKFTIHIFAALAEYERELISQRTKAALARSTKPKGTKGMVNLRNSAEAGRALGREANVEKADEFALEIGELIHEYMDQGMARREIAAKLNSGQILTSRKYKKDADGNPTDELLLWTSTAVQRVQKRLGLLT